MSAAFLVAAGASQAGMWLGAAGVPVLGLQASREAGVALERVVAVRAPDAQAPDGQGRVSGAARDEWWGQVLGALVDGFDLVLFGAASQVRPGTARRVQSRLQSRGAVLLIVGHPGGFSCDVQITTESAWSGLGDGHGHLRARRVDLAVDGRRIPRTRRGSIWFPGAAGEISSVGSVSSPLAAPPVDQTLAVVAGDAPAPVAAVPLRRTG
jgi:hypothetical protein